MSKVNRFYRDLSLKDRRVAFENLPLLTYTEGVDIDSAENNALVTKQWVTDNAGGGFDYGVVNSTGTLPTATGSESIVIGSFSSDGGGVQNVIIGNSVVNSSGSTRVIAIGQFNTANFGIDTVSIAREARALTDRSIAIGRQSQTANGAMIALGASSIAKGTNSLTIGSSAGNNFGSTAGNYNITIGNEANNDGTKNIGNYSIGIGYSSLSERVDAIAIGTNSRAFTGDRPLAIGKDSTSGGFDSIAIGTSANCSSSGGIAIGNGTSNNGASAIAMGNGASAAGNFSMAFGASAGANNTESIAFGAFTVVRNQTMSIGHYAESYGGYGIALGYDSYIGSASPYAIAVGYGTRVDNTSSVGGIAIGRNINSEANGAIIMGYHTSIQINNLANSFELAWDGSTGFKTGLTLGTQVLVDADPATNLTDVANGAIAYDSTDNELQAYVNGAWVVLA